MSWIVSYKTHAKKKKSTSFVLCELQRRKQNKTSTTSSFHWLLKKWKSRLVLLGRLFLRLLLRWWSFLCSVFSSNFASWEKAEQTMNSSRLFPHSDLLIILSMSLSSFLTTRCTTLPYLKLDLESSWHLLQFEISWNCFPITTSALRLLTHIATMDMPRWKLRNLL